MSVGGDPIASGSVGARARLVRTVAGPICICDGTSDLSCAGCGQVLVIGWVARMLVGLDLQCPHCGRLTRTPDWPDGEPIVGQVVVGNDVGVYTDSEPVDLRGRDNIIISEAALKKARQSTMIGSRPSTMRAQDGAGLDVLQADLMCDCPQLSDCIASTERAIRGGNHRFLSYPLAWSLLRLRARNDHDPWTEDDLVASTYVDIANHMLARWGHHAFAPTFRRGLVFEFHHTISQLLAASSLADSGLAIGFTTPAQAGGRTADMFINTGAVSRINVEVKAPTQLQWPAGTISADRLGGLIEKMANKKARGQLPKGESGMLVLGASLSDQAPEARIERVASDLATRKRLSSRVEAVLLVNLLSHSEGNVRLAPGTWHANVAKVLNPRYAGPKRIELAD